MTTMAEPRTTNTAKNWRLSASCRYDDPELWFPTSWTSASGKAQAAEAVRICNACPARQQCLDQAIDMEGGRTADNRFGIRGGLTPNERLRVYRRRTRGG